MLCITVHLYNTHEPIPLDNLKNLTALLYITWGLIQDLKIKKEIPIGNKIWEYQLTYFTRLPLRILKIRESNSTLTSHEERREILVVKFIASENRKSES